MPVERKVVRVRLEPRPAQAARIAQFAGARRWVWNWALARKQEHYQSTGKSLSSTALCRELTELKQQADTAWLADMHAQSLQQALRDLDAAYNAFFAGRARYPRFKSRKTDVPRFRLPQNIRVRRRRVFIPKVGWVRASQPVALDAKETLKSATFKLAPTGHWYACLVIEFEMPEREPLPVREKTTVGIDLGLKDLAVLSTGEKEAAPRYYRAQERRLARAQRALSRKQRGSRNREKARLRVARLHEQTRNRRQDFTHKLTTRLVREWDTIVIEDLNARAMARTKLSKSVLDASLGEIRRQLEYKSRWHGKNLVVIDRWFPSSKLCGDCGLVRTALSLNERQWVCACGAVLDRDLNAAGNIKREGLRLVALGARETRNACGGDVRPHLGAVAAEAGTPRL